MKFKKIPHRCGERYCPIEEDIVSVKESEEIQLSMTVSDTNKLSYLLNVDFTKDGAVIRRKGWKTFDEMIRVLFEINKKYRELGQEGNFTLRLPLKRSRGKNKINL